MKSKNEILSNVIIGTALGGFAPGGMDRKINSTPEFQKPQDLRYKARPLNGVWAESDPSGHYGTGNPVEAGPSARP